MENKRFSKNAILTIPNLISLFRILLIPLIIWLYCGKKQYAATIAVVAISGVSDIIDGKIARKFNMVSDVGKVLDPIADAIFDSLLHNRTIRRSGNVRNQTVIRNQGLRKSPAGARRRSGSL